MEGLDNRKIKLIWEFFGEDAKKTAEHHAIHLEEFSKMKGFDFHQSGTEESSEVSIAYLIVDQSNMILVRDSLKPKRGEWV